MGGWLAPALLAIVLGAAALVFWRWSLQAGPLTGPSAEASGSEAVVPDSSRPSSDDELMAGLAQHLQRQPGDPRALIFKARIDLQAQRFALAAAGYERALQGRSKAALDAGVWVEYAEAVALTQGGRLAGRPSELLARALAINGQFPQALDLAGSAAWEAGDFKQAAVHWQRLLPLLQAGSPRHAALTTAIERAGQRARLALPPSR
jgi:cytochrome c-type biogenesis protein CcmH